MMNINSKYMKYICSVLLLCIILTLSSCVTSKSNSLDLLPSETPFTQINKSTPEPSETSISEMAEIPKPENAVSISDYETIVIDSYLIGAWNGDKWIDAETLYPMLPDESSYTIYTRSFYTMIDIGRKSMNEILDVSGAIIMDTVNFDNPLYQEFIALSGDKSLSFNFPEKKHPGNPVYQDWVDQICEDNGYPDLKLTICEVYEVSQNIYDDKRMHFISADNYYPTVGQKGSVQFVRMTIDEVGQSLILEKNFWISEDEDELGADTKLRYVCDLNRDGVMEIVTYINGAGEIPWGLYNVYSLHDGEYSTVLAEGWVD